MSDSVLRSSLIRLASAHPEFRKDLLPLIKQAAESCDSDKKAELDKVDEPLVEKTAATKTAGSIFFRHPVGVMVRVTSAKQYGADTMNTMVSGVMIVSLSSGAPMAPVNFIAVVRPSSGGWQVVSFRTRQSISGGGSDALINMCKEFFAAALAQKGDQLLHQEGVLETNEHGAIA